MFLSVIVILGCRTMKAAGKTTDINDDGEAVTDSTLVVLVDADYKMSHGWGHVFSCKVKDVIHGELEDSVFGLSVYATVQLYDDLLLSFKKYHDLKMTFTLNPERRYGPPPGFRDSHGNYWELISVSRSKAPFVDLIANTLYQYFPDLAGFNSTIGTYAYDSFPPLLYSKPAPEEWSKGLKVVADGDSVKGFVKIWRKEGKIEYIWITAPYPDGGEFYAFGNDMVDVLYPVNSRGYLFMTQVGVVKWRYIYEIGLLRKQVFYRTSPSSPSSPDRPQAASPIWAVDEIEYWPGTDTPHYTYRFNEPGTENVSGKSWNSRKVFDSEGKLTREEDSKGTVLWERRSP